MSDNQSDDEPPPLATIGNTLFARANNLEMALGFKNIYLKFEGSNPTGTQKDRVAVYHINNALKAGYNGITVGTCGNYGVSISHFAKLVGLRTVVFVPKEYYITPQRKQDLIQSGATIFTIDGKYEDAVEESKRFSRDKHFYDANPGNGTYGWFGYMQIAYEIFTQLGKVPTAVSVPVGNGTTLTGIYCGFKKLFDAQITDRMPNLIGSSTPGGNPIVKSFKEGATKIEDLLPSSIKETPINEPLISYHSYDGVEALKAIYDTNGWADYASDDKMIQLSHLISDTEGFNVLPASASALEALIQFKQHRVSNSDYVIVLTGRKFC